MPKNYDFSVRNVDWSEYKDDYLLRTDAVWERTKLLDLFYTHYKSKFLYDSVNNKYMIANIRQMPMPTNETEHFEDSKPPKPNIKKRGRILRNDTEYQTTKPNIKKRKQFVFITVIMCSDFKTVINIAS